MTVIEALISVICHTEIEVNRVYFLRFYTKYDTRFSKYGIELIVALSSTKATKIARSPYLLFTYCLILKFFFLPAITIWTYVRLTE